MITANERSSAKLVDMTDMPTDTAPTDLDLEQLLAAQEAPPQLDPMLVIQSLQGQIAQQAARIAMLEAELITVMRRAQGGS